MGKIVVGQKPSFEDSYEEILVLIEKKRSRWQFKASLMMDFDDVKMKIATHIYQKWHQYDSNKPLGAWVNKIIQHQMLNILRDCYLSTSPPCSKCPCNLGDKMCSMFGQYSTECLPYAAWSQTKKFRHEARMPLPIEGKREIEVLGIRSEDFNVETAIPILHEKVKAHLSPADWEIYKRLYIENKEMDEVATELGFVSTEPGRPHGYKRMRQVTKRATEIVKKILAEEGVEGLK